ncbi:MAG: hypothetical protein JNN10_15630 [Sphingopyxis sp.]|nr:hypothetical protein [Sphingopyxis sp.]
MVSDDGVAPCTDDDLLTLATCKPVIRRKARVGDWVVGYNPSSIGSNLVVWAGRVHEKMDPIAYEKEYRGRKDAAYRTSSNGKPERVYDYHMDDRDMAKDLSADVLIFDRAATWYFGAEPCEPHRELTRLAPLKQRGHLVHKNSKPGDPALLQRWLNEVSRPGIHAPPRDLGKNECHSACDVNKRINRKAC